MQRLFKFVDINGQNITKSFNIVPISYPIGYDKYVITGDPITYSTSPQLLDIYDNIYKIENNYRATNDWFINLKGTTNDTASATIISGSYYTGNIATVLFNFIDHVFEPKDIKNVEFRPKNKNVGWEDSFVVGDPVVKNTDNEGSITINLLPIPIDVIFHGPKKHTQFTILPEGECTASNIIITPHKIAKIITPQNQSNYGYTAEASDARYVRIGDGGGIIPGGSYDISASWASSSISASYAKTSSYGINFQANVITASEAKLDIIYGSSIFADGIYMIGGIINPYNPDEEISFTNGYIKFPEFRGTSSVSISSSYALTASYIASENIIGLVLSSSYALSSSNAKSASYTLTASWASSSITSFCSISSSNAETAVDVLFQGDKNNKVILGEWLNGRKWEISTYAGDGTFYIKNDAEQFLYPFIIDYYTRRVGINISNQTNFVENFFDINKLIVEGNIICSAITASLFYGTASQAISSSHALTASYILGGGGVTPGGSYDISASWASSSISASYGFSSSYAESASYATFAYTTPRPLTSSYAKTSSFAHNIKASNLANVFCEAYYDDMELDSHPLFKRNFYFTTMSAVTDPGNLFWNNKYHVPMDGVYFITTKFRVSDIANAGISYGQGADTDRVDSPNFVWFETNQYRNGSVNTRISHFNSGSEIGLVYYYDNNYDGDLTYANMTVQLLYPD